MKKLYSLTCLIFVISCCKATTQPLPTDNTGDCMTVETHLKELSCISNDKPYTKKGKSFSQFCQETIQGGASLNLKCLLAITNCNQIDNCVQGK